MEKQSFVAPVTGAEYYIDYMRCVSDIISHPAIRELENYSQHSKCDRLRHSLYVSYNSYRICRKLGLDAKSAARGGLLHDFFLYDRRDADKPKGLHGIIHPRMALKNASRLFKLNKIEKDVIKRHMFPLTITPPRYRESIVVMFVDKYCACMEALDKTQNAGVSAIWEKLPA